nr:MAG: hypothetical protein DIU78_06560 [Pseudomonadota bacterium]
MIPILMIAPGCWEPDVVPANYGQWGGTNGASEGGGAALGGGVGQGTSGGNGGTIGTGGQSNGGNPAVGGTTNSGGNPSGGSSSGGTPGVGGSGSGGTPGLGGSSSGGTSPLGGSGSNGDPSSGGMTQADYPPPSACMQTILTSCNICHGAQAALIGGDLDLRGSDVAARLVDQPATYSGVPDAEKGKCVQGAKLIDSQNPSESVLLKKVKSQQACGTPMPAPTGLGSADQVCVETWINSLF